jgi:hypothetical protein
MAAIKPRTFTASTGDVKIDIFAEKYDLLCIEATIHPPGEPGYCAAVRLNANDIRALLSFIQEETEV